MEQAKVRYAELEEKLKHLGKLTQYLPGLDSSSTALNFLDQKCTDKGNQRQATKRHWENGCIKSTTAKGREHQTIP
jgi:hypothetical protein